MWPTFLFPFTVHFIWLNIKRPPVLCDHISLFSWNGHIRQVWLHLYLDILKVKDHVSFWDHIESLSLVSLQHHHWHFRFWSSLLWCHVHVCNRPLLFILLILVEYLLSVTISVYNFFSWLQAWCLLCPHWVLILPKTYSLYNPTLNSWNHI